MTPAEMLATLAQGTRLFSNKLPEGAQIVALTVANLIDSLSRGLNRGLTAEQILSSIERVQPIDTSNDATIDQRIREAEGKGNGDS